MVLPQSTANINRLGRRFVGSVGGFNFTPGDVIEVDLAFTFSRSDSGHLKSVDQLYRDIQVVQAFYNDSIKPCSDSLIGSVSILENKNEVTFLMFPNPTQNKLTIDLGDISLKDPILSIYDLTGKIVYTEKLATNITSKELNIKSFATGVYFVKIQSDQQTFVQKLVKE